MADLLEIPMGDSTQLTMKLGDDLNFGTLEMAQSTNLKMTEGLTSLQLDQQFNIDHLDQSTKVNWAATSDEDSIFNLPLPQLTRQCAMNFKVEPEVEEDDEFDFDLMELPVLSRQHAMNFPAPQEMKEEKSNDSELNLNVQFELNDIIPMQKSINLDALEMIESKAGQIQLPKELVKQNISKVEEENEEMDEEFDFDSLVLSLPSLKRQDAMNFQTNDDIKPKVNNELPVDIQNLLASLLSDISKQNLDGQMARQFNNAQQMMKSGHFGLANNMVNNMLNSGILMEMSQNNMEMTRNVEEFQRMQAPIKLQ